MTLEKSDRKRKSKNKNNGVPVKKSKHAENGDLLDSVEEQQNFPAEDETPNNSVEHASTNFSRDFKMLKFREKLRGKDFITELQHFLHLVDIKPQIVAKYIEKRGKPLELAEALERVDKTNINHVFYLCEALHLVIMEILSNHKAHTESAEHACRFFLKSHGSVIEALLKSSNLRHRKCGLKLLTAMVCVEPQLGRQLLSSFDILSNVRAIENFLSHSKFELEESETVRKCYIHFILSYLVDGNQILIRNILDKSVLIKALASGLLYDDHVTVCVVLSTMKKFVLENAEISKTKKVNIFDVDCVKSFVRLYDWRGPQALAAKLGARKKSAAEPSIEQLRKLADPAAKESVSDAAHDFLLLLLTSRKNGIAFDAMLHFQQRHNKLQGKIIGFLEKPWLSEKKTELVLEILKACPELARNTVRHYGALVNPLITPPHFWVVTCEFIEKIINEMHPKLLKGALEKITLTDFSHWIKDICLPIEILLHLSEMKALRHTNFQHRLIANRLLLTMFNQYTNYMAAIIDREQQKQNNLRRFKFDLLNHIFVNFPTVEDILYSMYETIKEQDKDGVNVNEHLELTLDLLLIICQHNQSFVNMTSTIMDYFKILQPLYSTDEGEGNIKLELKAIKTILLLFPKALEPQEELFKNVLKSFLNAFVFGDSDIQREAGELLRGIFLNTGIFHTRELEIDLWLEAVRFVDTETVKIVSSVFIEVLQLTKVDVESTANPIEGTYAAKLFSNIEKGLTVQGHVDTITMSKLYPLITKNVEINEKLEKYLQIVNLLICQYKNGATDENTNSFYELTKDATSIPHLVEIHSAVLEGKSKFKDIFQRLENGKSSFPLILSDNKEAHFDRSLQNNHLVMIYIQKVLYLISQLVKTEALTLEQSNSAADFMVHFLKIINALSLPSKPTTLTSLDENEQEVELTYMEKTLKYVFNSRLGTILTPNLLSTNKCNINYLNFVQQITACVNTFEIKLFPNFTSNLRQKIVKSIEEATVEDKDALKNESEVLQPVLHVIEAFQLSTEDCLNILKHLAVLSYKDFITDAGQKSIFLDILILILEQISNRRQPVEFDESVVRIAQIYIDLITKCEFDVNLERLEEALHSFLITCHQCIPRLPLLMFSKIFTHRKLSKSAIRLACLLFERNPNLDAEFVQMLPKNIHKKELIYPLLNIALTKGTQIESSLLASIYQEYKNGFMKTIEKPQKAGVIYKENVLTSTQLIHLLMPKSECIDFCNKSIKFESVEVFQVKVIRAIFRKALASIENPESDSNFSKVFVQFLNTCVQMLNIVVKKDFLDEEKIIFLSFVVYDLFQSSNQQNFNFEKIINSQMWMNLCKTALKTAMHLDETEENRSVVDRINGAVLKLLAFLCDKLYSDEENNQEAGQLFEMIFTHSKFLKSVLQIHPTAVKTQIMHLLFVLARKCPSVLENKQIPMILGAYQAKLSDSDRYTLALLQLYEEADVGLHQYRPFIWGESAIAFYSLRDDQHEKNSLEHQETSVAQVMSLIDRHSSEHTLDNFPIWRNLDPSSQLPSVTFDDPDKRHLALFANNFIEKRIELNDCKFTEVELRLCPKREKFYDECYDPAFIVPLMSMCFAPEIYSHPVRPVQNGLLSIVFASLSSQDKEMRMAAGCVQLRYRQHFENSKFFEKPFWTQAYDNIQSGLDALRINWLKHKKHGGIPRVPYISGLFLAKTINVTTDPTHILYKQLTMFLRLKDTFNFLSVPEFNILFYSPEIEHNKFRKFIVDIIRNGVKNSSDLFLLVTTSTFKALMGFYESTVATLDINLTILSVLSVCVKIPGSAKIMIEHVGIIPWLNSVLNSVEFYHFDIIEGIISIINNLWYSVKANSKKFYNFKHIQSDIYRLIMRLLPNLSGRVSAGNFAKLLNILDKTTGTEASKTLSSAQLVQLINCAKKLYGSDLFNSVTSITEYGAEGMESEDSFCRTIAALEIDSHTKLAVCSLRQLAVKYSQ